MSLFFVVELVWLYESPLKISAVGSKLHHPIIFLYIYSSWVKIRLLTENQGGIIDYFSKNLNVPLPIQVVVNWPISKVKL